MYTLRITLPPMLHLHFISIVSNGMFRNIVTMQLFIFFQNILICSLHIFFKQKFKFQIYHIATVGLGLSQSYTLIHVLYYTFLTNPLTLYTHTHIYILDVYSSVDIPINVLYIFIYNINVLSPHTSPSNIRI